MLYHPGGVPYHPCSPSSLAKAAAPERASTEPGADFCHLDLPSRMAASSTLVKPSQSQSSQGLRARRQANITQSSSFMLEWQSPLPSAHNVRPSSALPHRHPRHHRLLLHGLHPRGWTAIMEPQQTIDYNSSFPRTSTSSTSDSRVLGEMGEGDG